MQRTTTTILLSAWALVAILTGGCMRSVPSYHYTLSALATPAPEQSPHAIGVGPVTVPLHLRQPALVVRTDPYTLSYNDTHSWAQPVEDGIPQVVGENLSRLTGTRRVTRYPWAASEEVTHQVILRVMAFELDSQGKAVFRARWELRDGQARLIDSGLAEYTEDVDGDPSRAAAALSQALLHFSEMIATKLDS